MTDEHLRMSDAERERAAAELGEHYAQGRLTVEEHSERLDRIWAARTRGELGPIFADLPGRGAGPTPTRRATTGRRLGGLPTPLVVLVAVLVAVAVLTHLPLLVVGLLVWFLLVRRGSCGGRPHRAHWS